MSEETLQPEGGVPPKLDLKTNGAAAPAPTTPEGVTPAAESGPALKKKTTRVPLPEGEAGGPAPVPKTIRLAPPPGMAKPLTIPTGIPTGRPTVLGEAEKPKRETSRIPLEAALGTAEAAPEGRAPAGPPKTIRIKRPGQPAVVKPPAPPSGEPVTETVGTAEKSKTARVDLAAVTGAEAGQPTQRKTIKIRRPEAGAPAAIPRSVRVARVEAEAAERVAVEAGAPGIVYSLVALAALLVVCGLIYVLMAQAFPALNLALPGKVSL